MAINSRDKGKSAERELCKILEAAFTGSFIRSANSGAFVGGKNSFRKENLSANQIRGQKADIIPPDFMPKFVVESKFYKEFPYHQLICGSVPLLDGWVNQNLECCDDNDFWMVAFKTNRKPWMAVISADHWKKIKAPNKLWYNTARGTSCLVLSLETLLNENSNYIRSATA